MAARSYPPRTAISIFVLLASGPITARAPAQSQPAQPAPAQTPEQQLAEVKAQYTKYEYRVPMRDGKRLFTAVYVPKDQTQTWPILMMRTPYSAKPYGADQYRAVPGPSPLFTKAGYIFVIQ